MDPNMLGYKFSQSTVTFIYAITYENKSHPCYIFKKKRETPPPIKRSKTFDDFTTLKC